LVPGLFIPFTIRCCHPSHLAQLNGRSISGQIEALIDDETAGASLTP
jgi:hypothetical protein